MASTLPKISSPDVLKLVSSSAKALRLLKKVDPRERYVLLYPEASRAFVGMGFNLLNSKAAERVYEEANELMESNIFKLCLDGPKNKLRANHEMISVAAYVTSHATMAKMEQEKPHVIEFCKGAGGMGVGFVNALVFSKAMSFANGLDLVRKRAQAMDMIDKSVPSARIRINVKPATNVRRVCHAAREHCLLKGIPEELAVCGVSKHLGPHKLELAGHEEAIKYLENQASHLIECYWMSRTTQNQNAFYTDLMKPAQELMQLYIDQRLKTDPDYLREPETCSVYSSTAGMRLRALKNIKRDLCNYPVKPIQVVKLLHCMFKRPASLAQPNILVVWDRQLVKMLADVNFRARNAASLLKA